ncbi:MAG: exonuclease domain-containing protein [Thiotrichales bacterium]
MFHLFLNQAEKQRKKLLSTVSDAQFKAYLEHPLPDLDQSIENTEFLALDFETTGLDPDQGAILSIGYTVIKHSRILLKKNGHLLVRINKPLPHDSVVIHHITDDRMSLGEPLTAAINKLLLAMAGRALLVHYQGIEKPFLNAAGKQLFGSEIPAVYVDTLDIARKRLSRAPVRYGPHHLRLFNLRDYYQLPRYHAHNALEDAIATAELFLAEMNAKGTPLSKIKLKTVIS